MEAKSRKPKTTPKADTKVAVKAVRAKKSTATIAILTKPKQKPTNNQTSKIPAKKVKPEVRTVVKLKKEREPRNTKITITNNSVKPKVSVSKFSDRALQKKAPVPSTSVLPKPAVPSPYRFPLLSPNSLALVARVVGIFFIGVGSILSVFNITAVQHVYQTAQVSDATPTTNMNGTVASTPISTNTSGTTTYANIDTTPDPQIFINSSMPLKGVAPIKITVPLAENINVLVLDRTNNQIFTLGTASRVDITNWLFSWNTTGFADGEYRVRLLITNAYGTYDYAGSETYTVENQNASVPPVLDNIATSSVLVSTEPQIHPVPGENPVHGGVTFEIEVDDAEKVSLHARNKYSGVLYYLGTAREKNNGVWELVWDSTSIPDGEYDLYAKSVANGAVSQSDKEKMYVQNKISTATTTISTLIENEMHAPTVELVISNEATLHAFVPLTVYASGVMWVELYSLSKSSLVARFLGLATRVSDTEWKYLWDTTQTPNGEYVIYPRVKSTYGFSEGNRESVKVFNAVEDTFTPEEETVLESIKSVESLMTTDTDDIALAETAQGEERKVVYVESVSDFVDRVEVADIERTYIETVLGEYRSKLTPLLDSLAKAQRQNDTTEVLKIRAEIENLTHDIISVLPGNISEKEIIDQINTYLSETSYQLQEMILHNETILKERVGDAILNDSDKDSITDYDEVRLYKTNPFSADTDGDGFTDGIEVEKGFDPLNSSREALMVYQSPKESGVVRDDVLTIDMMTTLSRDTLEETPKAFLSGKALPNSFVTLYIFSMPVVVTVRTDNDGSWSYIFDKELDNGDHEVYVAMTDNAGMVVAKSSPLPFVKTAEAFTVKNASGGAAVDVEAAPKIIDDTMMLLIASLIVVSLGLLLILIGIHARNREFVDTGLQAQAT